MAILIVLLAGIISVLAYTNVNLDGGPDSTNNNTSNDQTKWSNGEGVRATLINNSTGNPEGNSVDFINPNMESNAAQTAIWFGTNKLNNIGRNSLSEIDGGYRYEKLAKMPVIITSNDNGARSLTAIREFFSGDSTLSFIADDLGTTYSEIQSGKYKLMLEPVAYVRIDGLWYAATETELAILHKQSDALYNIGPLIIGNFANSMYLEEADLGMSAGGNQLKASMSKEQKCILIRDHLGVMLIDIGGGEPDFTYVAQVCYVDANLNGVYDTGEKVITNLATGDTEVVSNILEGAELLSWRAQLTPGKYTYYFGGTTYKEFSGMQNVTVISRPSSNETKISQETYNLVSSSLADYDDGDIVFSYIMNVGEDGNTERTIAVRSVHIEDKTQIIFYGYSKVAQVRLHFVDDFEYDASEVAPMISIPFALTGENDWVNLCEDKYADKIPDDITGKPLVGMFGSKEKKTETYKYVPWYLKNAVITNLPEDAVAKSDREALLNRSPEMSTSKGMDWYFVYQGATTPVPVKVSVLNYNDVDSDGKYNSAKDTLIGTKQVITTTAMTGTKYEIVKNGLYSADEVKVVANKDLTLYSSYALDDVGTGGTTTFIYNKWINGSRTLAEVRNRKRTLSRDTTFYFGYRALEDEELITVKYLEAGTLAEIQDPLTLPISSSKIGKKVNLIDDLHHTAPDAIGEYIIYKSYVFDTKLGGIPSQSFMNEAWVNKTNDSDDMAFKTIPQVLDRERTLKEGGLTFVFEYLKEDTTPTVPEDPSNPTSPGASVDTGTPDLQAVIKADNRDSEKFDVSQGIPTTEDLYVNVLGKGAEYIAQYSMTNLVGKKTYNVVATKNYTYRWTVHTSVWNEATQTWDSDSETRTASETVTTNVTVERMFSYYSLGKYNLWALGSANVKNDSLPGGEVNLTPNGYTAPTGSYWHSNQESEHLDEPDGPFTVSLPAQTINGGSSRPSYSVSSLNSEAKTAAEARVGQIKVRNDEAVFKGTTIMSKAWADKTSPAPTKQADLPFKPSALGKDVFYVNGKTIDKVLNNGVYDTIGTVTYKQAITSTGDNITDSADVIVDIQNTNDVIVHTPVYNNTKFTVNNKNTQLISRNTNNNMILGTAFRLTINTNGQHLSATGYGDQDYSKYVERKEIRFPFDVYKVDGTFYKADTWIDNALDTDFTGFLPTWVKEDTYKVDTRVFAINSSASNKGEQSDANLDRSKYVATDSFEVEVSGRVFGLSLYDISDTTSWKGIFRTENLSKSLGNTYTVGIKTENGGDDKSALGSLRIEKYTFPLVEGSHPSKKNVGPLKLGYVSRFSLASIGNMEKDNSFVTITPKYYYVKADGTGRQEVDLFYSETILGKFKQFVKVGSATDKTNIKLYYTDDKWLAIPGTELSTTADLLGYTGTNKKFFTSAKTEMSAYTLIRLGKFFRTFVGNLTRNTTGEIKILPTGFSLSPLVPVADVTKSVQTWYAEFGLPAETYAIPKGTSTVGVTSSKFKENLWLQDGYIIVNFEIKTYKDGKPYLTYYGDGLEGNMWAIEQGNTTGNSTKSDYKGNTFNFKPGDYLMYYTNKSVNSDFGAGGTH